MYVSWNDKGRQSGEMEVFLNLHDGYLISLLDLNK